METMSVDEARTRLSAVLAEVEAGGKSFTICRDGRPIAELIPYRKPSRLTYHPLLSKIDIRYDPTEDVSEGEWGEVE